MADRLAGLSHVLAGRADDPTVARDTLRLVTTLQRGKAAHVIARLIDTLPEGDERHAAMAWAVFRDMLEGWNVAGRQDRFWADVRRAGDRLGYPDELMPHA